MPAMNPPVPMPTPIPAPASLVPLVWIVDDDASIRLVLNKTCQRQQWRTQQFDSAEALLQHCTQLMTLPPTEQAACIPHVLMTDVRMGAIDGITLVQQIKLNALLCDVPVILMTAFSDLDTAVSGFQSGIFEYLVKPVDVHQLVEVLKKALSMRGLLSASATTATLSQSSQLSHDSSQPAQEVTPATDTQHLQQILAEQLKQTGGYLERLPKDPWGNPYQYLNPGLKGDVDILSYGADGQAGGEGVDADIGAQ